MEVFPTLWSPRNTSLYLASGANEVVPVIGLRAGAFDGDDPGASGAEAVELILLQNLSRIENKNYHLSTYCRLCQHAPSEWLFEIEQDRQE